MYSKKLRKKINPVRVGDVFPINSGGEVTVIEYKNAKEVLIEFNDENRHQKITQAVHLREGTVFNPFNPSVSGRGYLGFGKYCTSLSGENKKIIEYWRGMMARCYDPIALSKRPTYENCEVAEIWYDYQEFCDWMKNHAFYGLGYHLDKDLLSGVNKIYSPETCTFLPHEINIALQLGRKKKDNLPVGVFKRDGGRYRAILAENGKLVHYGTHDTIEEASAAYVEAKERYVKNKALEWANRIEWKAFKALMEWKVYPEGVYPDETADQQVA